MKKILMSLIYFGWGLLSLLGAAETEIHVVRGDGNYPPNEMGTDPQVTGIHIDLVNQVAQTLQLKVKWESVPWTRAVNMIKDGEADAITYIGKTPEREQFVHFVEGNEVSIAENGFVILKENASRLTYTGDYKQLKVLEPVVVLRGYTYGGTFDQTTEIQKYPVKELDQVLNMLKSKKYSIGIVNVGEAKPIARSLGIRDQLVFLEPFVSQLPNYIGFSKKRSNLEVAQKFASAIKAFKQTSAYQEILKKYGVQ